MYNLLFPTIRFSELSVVFNCACDARMRVYVRVQICRVNESLMMFVNFGDGRCRALFFR